ncbi:MAG: hypothetical protein MR639_06265 [Clostridium sp.]|uniref:hypothetical protein n=1 Tax=Clostridium sp. TaxID=1506 RepID=UPI002A88147F|nr:hypothetical protein [Clostridium sp.]MDY5099207.1 hypothetical protein [Clostridium sp.]
MKNSKKNTKLIITLIVLIFALFITIISIMYPKDNFTIVIDNQTSINFNNSYIKYIVSEERLDIPSISKKSTQKLHMNSVSKFDTNSMKFYYIDKKNKTKDLLLLKDFSDKTKATINLSIVPSNNDDGFEINVKTAIYE